LYIQDHERITANVKTFVEITIKRIKNMAYKSYIPYTSTTAMCLLVYAEDIVQ